MHREPYLNERLHVPPIGGTMKSFASILFGVLFLNAHVFGQMQSVKHSGNVNSKPGRPDRLLSCGSEDFETDKFPPAGWVLEFNGIQYWSRFVGASGYGAGTASAVFQFYNAPANITQNLVLTSMGRSVLGDSLRFDHAYATFSTENDRLVIETSTDGGTTYVNLVTLNGDVSGALVTAPPTFDVFVPAASQWATKRYALPVGTNRVRFVAVSALGNNLYLDNFSVGARVPTDVAVQSIEMPNPTLTLPQAPKATVRNLGTATQTFTVTALISPGGYSSTRTVAALAGNAILQVTFDGWMPTVGMYNITAFTTLAGDLDQTNDTSRLALVANPIQPVTNIDAFFRDGQVFVTWDNIPTTNVRYTLYKSSDPIRHGANLTSAQNLGDVRDFSARDQRLTGTGASVFLKIDPGLPPLAMTKGLFVATSTTAGSFYYAITPTVGGLEDTTIVVGSNALASPVSETVMMPKPVWQETRIIDGRTFEIYVQFATKVTSSIYPQMTNAGSYPFHFAIVKSGTTAPHPVTFWMHGQGGSFLPSSSGFRTTGIPNEWIVTIDDWLPGMWAQTSYYGYHENYDIYSSTSPLFTSGTLYNYTAARVAHTVNWAIRNLAVDSTRTYMTGHSMGAIGSLFNSIMISEKIAAIFIYAPRATFVTGGNFWGAWESNLLTNEGYRRNERVNAAYLVSARRMKSLPIMFIFYGKNDQVIEWNEKIPFFDSLNANRHGTFHFWSLTDHYSVFSNSPWQPSFPDFSFFTRYRTNLSYPAFSNCNLNNNPGDGDPANGDPIGTINGHLDWNDDIVDTTNRWEVTLRVKDLATTSGTRVAPEAGYTDVTLRRLQQFNVPVGSTIHWVNEQNGINVQEKSFTYDGEPITIPVVKVYKTSSRLKVFYDVAGLVQQPSPPLEYRLEQNYPNPFNPKTGIRYQVPGVSNVKVVVYDVLGREVALLVDEKKSPGTYEVHFDGSGLASGVYVYRLTAGDFVDSKKLVLLK
jgi:hypothetical protein